MGDVGGADPVSSGSAYSAGAVKPTEAQVEDVENGSEPDPPQEASRERWSGRTAFVLAAIGSAIGLGNLWRFPHLSYVHGGGAFFIPYLLSLFFIAIPLMTLEMGLGQVFQGGHVVAFNKINWRLRGVGYAAPWNSFVVITYYTAILAWSLIYFVNSFSGHPPWIPTDEETYMCESLLDEHLCSNDMHNYICSWNANYDPALCVADINKKANIYYEQVLNLSGDPSAGMTLNGSGWSVLGLFVTFLGVFLAVSFGTKVLGYILYVTITLPVVLLIIMLIRGVTLPGAEDGIKAYIAEWDMSKLVDDLDIWVDAVGQIFLSSSVALGVMTAYASFNRANQNISQDSVIVCCSNSFFSFVAGFVVFSVIGYLSYQSGVPIAELETSSFGLCFVTFPVAFWNLGTPSAQIFCALFFLMFFLLGMSSAFSIIKAPTTNITDTKIFARLKIKTIWVTLLLCVAGFLFGLMYVSNNGLYWLDLMDHYALNHGTVFMGLMESIGASWLTAVEVQTSRLGFWSVASFGLIMGVGCLVCVTGGIFIPAPANYGSMIPLALILIFGGYFLSMWLAKRSGIKDEEGNAFSFKDRSYWLLIGNVEELRTLINWAVSEDFRWMMQKKGIKNHHSYNNPKFGIEDDEEEELLSDKTKCCCCGCPRACCAYLTFGLITVVWSVLLKFVIPAGLIFVLIANISMGNLGYYEQLPALYQVLGCIVLFIGIIMVIIGLTFPQWYNPVLPLQIEEQAPLIWEDVLHKDKKTQSDDDNKASAPDDVEAGEAAPPTESAPPQAGA